MLRPKGRISTVNMNTPKFKMGAGMQYAGEGVSYGMSLTLPGFILC